ncbi:class II SORL domain-containing protein [Sulfurospirillum barnesii]|uniref:Desulfoferrodoxin n=1 Tax=Sulfurospirillum barnesii (strain ATCC 700032 / DSM 10660 / SES-3) TaxID=760154 RepID=I3XWQ1_SULBS|nr:class II SORL domain-containing protein [Sulfurospirillum barnesii]AFL68375.1 Desulfoferrodoxin [Sulfurospirillum barnesii SES-3]
MPKINRYVDIDTVEREAKKDYIDRHSPFIACEPTAKQNEPFKVTIKVGNVYSHPDDFDHYIANVQLYNGETLLARADFVSGTLGGQDKKGQAEVTFTIIPTGKKLNLVAHSYCTKHGVWESEPVEVSVAE